MSSNIKTAMVNSGGTGSGVLVDITTSVTLNSTNTNDTKTRIYAIYADVAGVFNPKSSSSLISLVSALLTSLGNWLSKSAEETSVVLLISLRSSL